MFNISLWPHKKAGLLLGGWDKKKITRWFLTASHIIFLFRLILLTKNNALHEKVFYGKFFVFSTSSTRKKFHKKFYFWLSGEYFVEIFSYSTQQALHEKKSIIWNFIFGWVVNILWSCKIFEIVQKKKVIKGFENWRFWHNHLIF